MRSSGGFTELDFRSRSIVHSSTFDAETALSYVHYEGHAHSPSYMMAMGDDDMLYKMEVKPCDVVRPAKDGSIQNQLTGWIRKDGFACQESAAVSVPTSESITISDSVFLHSFIYYH